MAKQDPMMKGDQGDGNMKDDFMDFGDPKDGKSGKSKILIAVVLLLLVGGGGAYYYMSSQGEEPPMDEMIPAPKKTAKNSDHPTDLPTDTSTPAATSAPVDSSAMNTTPAPMDSATPPAPTNGTAPVAASAPLANGSTNPMTNGKVPTAPMKDDHAHAKELPKTTKEMGAEENAEEKEVVEPKPDSTPNLQTPENNATRNYDESLATATFSWTGGGTSWIRFSRSPTMSPVEHHAKTRKGSYELPRPAPGVWYWQVANSLGKSPIRTFTVNAPVKRNIAIIEPADGGTLVKDTGMVSWKGDRLITYYRVEVTSQGWANPNYRFATTGTQFQLRNVPQGNYEMRVGAFSEVSGRWEYTNPIKVVVQ